MQTDMVNLTCDNENEDSYFSKKVESFGALVWKRFRKHKLAVIGSIFIFILACSAIFAPLVCRFDPKEVHTNEVINGNPLQPSSKYWFGTDGMGRDYFARCIYGGRVSLSVGLVAVGISLLIGVPLGCIAGYYGGIADMIICRFIELLSCIPTFFLLLTVNAMLRPNIFNVMIILGVFGWMGITRLVRAQFLSLRQQEFVQAAYALGLKDRIVILRHLLPNALMPVIVSATMGVAGAILAESGLSYLGMGVQEPTPSWGSMLNTSQAYIMTAPWMTIFPGILITLVSLALNFIGDGLRDALDPRTDKI